MKKLLVVLSLLVVFVLAGCSSKKTYEYEISTVSPLEKVTVTSSLAFHRENYEKYKLIFADDGYIYTGNYNEDQKEVRKGSKWEKRGDIIVVIGNRDGEQYTYQNEYYQLYDDGKYLMEFHYGVTTYTYFYVAE